MAGSKSSVTGEDFYGAYDAQDTAAKHAAELNMQTVPSLNITYTEVQHADDVQRLGLTLLRQDACSYFGHNAVQAPKAVAL